MAHCVVVLRMWRCIIDHRQYLVMLRGLRDLVPLVRRLDFWIRPGVVGQVMRISTKRVPSVLSLLL